MAKDTTLTLGQRVRKLFGRLKITLFIVLITGGLAYAVILLNTILQEASDTSGYTSPLTPPAIDQATLDRIQSLHTSTEEYPGIELPGPRNNPFGE